MELRHCVVAAAMVLAAIVLALPARAESGLASSVLGQGCVDPAATNSVAGSTDRHNSDNTQCTYTCASLTAFYGVGGGNTGQPGSPHPVSLTAHFETSAAATCFIDKGPGTWPPSASGTYTVPPNSTAIIQGHAAWSALPPVLGPRLVGRVEAIGSASVIIRFVQMTGLSAAPQATSEGRASGGAVYVYGGSLIVEHTLFANNTADWYAGAIAVYGASDVVLLGVHFENNTASGAGAVFIRPHETQFRQAILTDCAGRRNVGQDDGFAVVVERRDGSISLSQDALLPASWRKLKCAGQLIFGVLDATFCPDHWLYMSVSIESAANCTLEALPPHAAAPDGVTSLPNDQTVDLQCQSLAPGQPRGWLLGEAQAACTSGTLLWNATCAECDVVMGAYCGYTKMPRYRTQDCTSCIGAHQRAMLSAGCQASQFTSFCAGGGLL